LQTYDACVCVCVCVCEYTCLQWICVGSVCWSSKPLPHGAIQISNIVYIRITFLKRSPNNCCSGKATIHSVCVFEVHVTVSCTKTISISQQCLFGKSMSQEKYRTQVFMWKTWCCITIKKLIFTYPINVHFDKINRHDIKVVAFL